MERAPRCILSLSAVVSATIMVTGMAYGQSTRFDALANLPFEQNRPTPETAKTLMDELEFQQATQAYLWAMPLINTLGMKFGSEKVFGAGYNILPVWKERLDTKTLVTTPNSDVIYAMSYVDMGETGPVVFEAPPNLQGILLDFWQRPIPVDGGQFFGDVGLPGPDAGKGGKFLVLPPNYKGNVPTGYYVYRSGTNNLFIFLRAFYQDPKDLSPAVTLMEQAKIYPLNLPEAERKPMQFPNASGVAANMLPRSDATAFEQLKWLVDHEGENLASDDGLGLLADRVTNRCRTATARPTSSSVRSLPPARKPTGLQRHQGGASSPYCGSTGRRRQPSITVGSPAISSRQIDWWTGRRLPWSTPFEFYLTVVQRMTAYGATSPFARVLIKVGSPSFCGPPSSRDAPCHALWVRLSVQSRGRNSTSSDAFPLAPHFRQRSCRSSDIRRV